jgi:hypothetical protein
MSLADATLKKQKQKIKAKDKSNKAIFIFTAVILQFLQL